MVGAVQVPVIPITLPKLDGLAGDAIAVFCWSDVRPLAGVAGYIDWRVCGALSDVLLSNFFRGDAGDLLMLPARGRFGPRRIFLFGLGSRAVWDPTMMRVACQRAVDVMQRAGVHYLVFAAPADPVDPACEATFAGVACGVLPPSHACVLVEYKAQH